jgi:hypothetical protein
MEGRKAGKILALLVLHMYGIGWQGHRVSLLNMLPHPVHIAAVDQVVDGRRLGSVASSLGAAESDAAQPGDPWQSIAETVHVLMQKLAACDQTEAGPSAQVGHESPTHAGLVRCAQTGCCCDWGTGLRECTVSACHVGSQLCFLQK